MRRYREELRLAVEEAEAHAAAMFAKRPDSHTHTRARAYAHGLRTALNMAEPRFPLRVTREQGAWWLYWHDRLLWSSADQ